MMVSNSTKARLAGRPGPSTPLTGRRLGGVRTESYQPPPDETPVYAYRLGRVEWSN